MNQQRFIILFLLTLFIFSGAFFMKANDTLNPYLIINLYDNNSILTELNDEFIIENIGKEIKVLVKEQPVYVSIEELESLGFIYLSEEDTSIDSLESDNPEEWKIYDSTGKLISTTFSNRPDLTNLMPGNIFIIKTKGKSFKYMPYK